MNLDQFAKDLSALIEERDKLVAEKRELQALLYGLLLTNGPLEYWPQNIRLRADFKTAFAVAAKRNLTYRQYGELSMDWRNDTSTQPDVRKGAWVKLGWKGGRPVESWEELEKGFPALFKDFEETEFYRQHPTGYDIEE